MGGLVCSVFVLLELNLESDGVITTVASELLDIGAGFSFAAVILTIASTVLIPMLIWMRRVMCSSSSANVDEWNRSLDQQDEGDEDVLLRRSSMSMMTSRRRQSNTRHRHSRESEEELQSRERLYSPRQQLPPREASKTSLSSSFDRN